MKRTQLRMAGPVGSIANRQKESGELDRPNYWIPGQAPHPQAPPFFYTSTPKIYTSTEKTSFWGLIPSRISPVRRDVSVQPPVRFGASVGVWFPAYFTKRRRANSKLSFRWPLK